MSLDYVSLDTSFPEIIWFRKEVGLVKMFSGCRVLIGERLTRTSEQGGSLDVSNIQAQRKLLLSFPLDPVGAL